MSANQYMAAGVDSAFSLEGFKKGFDISITRYEGDEMEFEMKGVSCAVSKGEDRVLLRQWQATDPLGALLGRAGLGLGPRSQALPHPHPPTPHLVTPAGQLSAAHHDSGDADDGD